MYLDKAAAKYIWLPEDYCFIRLQKMMHIRVNRSSVWVKEQTWYQKATLRPCWMEGQRDKSLDASWDPKDIGSIERESILHCSIQSYKEIKM